MTLKVLSIDDSVSVQALLKEMLIREGYYLVCCGSYNELVANYVKLLIDCDLILLDWEMPVKNGLEVLKELKENGVEIPIFMVTGNSQKSTVQKALSLGATNYILKPFSKETLLEKISVVK